MISKRKTRNKINPQKIILHKNKVFYNFIYLFITFIIEDNLFFK